MTPETKAILSEIITRKTPPLTINFVNDDKRIKEAVDLLKQSAPDLTDIFYSFCVIMRELGIDPSPIGWMSLGHSVAFALGQVDGVANWKRTK